MSRRKIVIADMQAFEAKYPHLVKKVTIHDSRKIFASLKMGFKIDGVEIVEGDEPEDEGDQSPAKEDASKNKPGVDQPTPAFLKKKSAEDAAAAKDAEAKDTAKTV